MGVPINCRNCRCLRSVIWGAVGGEEPGGDAFLLLAEFFDFLFAHDHEGGGEGIGEGGVGGLGPDDRAAGVCHGAGAAGAGVDDVLALNFKAGATDGVAIGQQGGGLVGRAYLHWPAVCADFTAESA